MNPEKKFQDPTNISLTDKRQALGLHDLLGAGTRVKIGNLNEYISLSFEYQ